MTLKPKQTEQTTQIEDIILETASVAMIQQDVPEISAHSNLEFEESYDDLDSLVYAILTFSHLKSRVALVRHLNSPTPGIEICVCHDAENIALLINETLRKLDLTSEDLIWIHPSIQDKYNLIEQVILKQ